MKPGTSPSNINVHVGLEADASDHLLSVKNAADAVTTVAKITNQASAQVNRVLNVRSSTPLTYQVAHFMNSANTDDGIVKVESTSSSQSHSNVLWVKSSGPGNNAKRIALLLENDKTNTAVGADDRLLAAKNGNGYL